MITPISTEWRADAPSAAANPVSGAKKPILIVSCASAGATLPASATAAASNHVRTRVMNPPFGAASLAARKEFEKAYPRTKNDTYAAFVERGILLLHPHGLLGAITSRTGFLLSSFQKWREELLLNEAPPVVFADLGYGVMDAAMVEGRSVFTDLCRRLSLREVENEGRGTLVVRLPATTSRGISPARTYRARAVLRGGPHPNDARPEPHRLRPRGSRSTRPQSLVAETPGRES